MSFKKNNALHGHRESEALSIATNAAYLSSARIITYCLRAFYVVILARSLGPELYGLFSYGQSWYLAYLPLTGLGIGVILSRKIGTTRNDQESIIPNTLTLRTTAVLTIGCLCGTIGWLVEVDPTAKQLLLIFSFALVGRGLALWAEEVFTACEMSHFTLRQEILFRTLEVLLGITVLSLGGGAAGVAITHGFIWWVQAIRGLLIVNQYIVRVKFQCAKRSLTSLLGHGMPIAIQTLFVAWLLQGPLVIYRHVTRSESDLGQLALVMAAFLLVYAVPASIGAAALPVLSRYAMRQDGKDRQFAEEMLRFGLLFGAAAGITGMAIGPWLVDLVFGSRYGPAGELLGPALWLLFPYTWGNAITMVLFARGQFLRPVACAFAGAAALTLFTPVLASNHSALGAILAAGIGSSVRALGLIPALAKRGGLDLVHSILWPTVAVLIALTAFFSLRLLSVTLALSVSWVILVTSMLLLGFFRLPRRLLNHIKSDT